MSVIKKQSIGSTQFMFESGDQRQIESDIKEMQEREEPVNVGDRVSNNQESMLLDNDDQLNSKFLQQGSFNNTEKYEKNDKKEDSQLKSKSNKQQNKLIISEFANQFDGDLQHQIKFLTHQVTYYEEKYLKYKNIAARQEDVIIKIIAELKRTKEDLNSHKEMVPAKLEVCSRTKDLELGRLKEQIVNKEKLIHKLEKKLNERMKVSQIVIEEVQNPNDSHEKKLQNLLCQQQKLLEQTNQKIQVLTEQLYQLSLTAIQQQGELGHLKSIILTLEHENNRILQQKQYEIQKNLRMKKMMEEQEKKIQELGNFIVELTGYIRKKKQQKLKHTNQQIGSNSTIRVRQ